MFEIGKAIISALLGWIPEIVVEGRKTGMRKTSYMVILLMVGLPIAAAYGAVTLAKAEDLDTLASGLKGLSARVDEINEDVGKKITNIQSNVNALVKIQLSSQLRDLKRRLCISSSQLDRNSLNGEIDRVQDQYTDLTGTHYVIPPCAEL